MGQTGLTVAAILQAGRLEAEALLLGLSARMQHQKILFCMPMPGALWREDPCAAPEICAALEGMGHEVRLFANRTWGTCYPQGNKIEALAALEEGPVLLLDTDTLLCTPLADLAIPFATASLRRSDSWPKGDPARIWPALYARFGLSVREDRRFTDWRRYPYFNAGAVAAPSARGLFTAWHEIASAIWEQPGPELAGEALTPWLDQISLPLALARLGGGKSGLSWRLDQHLCCHYRSPGLLMAREFAAAEVFYKCLEAPEARLLACYPPFAHFTTQEARALARQIGLDYANAPEAALRKALRAAGLWGR